MRKRKEQTGEHRMVGKPIRAALVMFEAHNWLALLLIHSVAELRLSYIYADLAG